jgi:hypothetical protein
LAKEPASGRIARPLSKPSGVMAGLDPAIHAERQQSREFRLMKHNELK